MLDNFVKHALDRGGRIKPLIIPSNNTNGTGLMNPSILNDDGVLRVILRHVNYTFYHSEKKLFQHQWGPLTYIHPENDMHLRTWNWYLELNGELDITRYHKIDTSQFDTYEPKWDFVGLEDARLIRWNDKLYTTGVRRDTTPNGQGRMELCEIDVQEDSVTEVSRWRIPTPRDPDSYCEKNWMPVIDKEYHYVKWCNPTEVVKVDPDTQTCETVIDTNNMQFDADPRGGSQVIKFEDKYVALTHEVDLFESETGRKDAVYYHRFLMWDEDFNLIKTSDRFLFMTGHVEFSTGMTHYNGNVLITFGFQDNAAYILEVKPEVIMEMLR